MEWRANRPSTTLGGEIGYAIIANRIQLPSGKFYIPRKIERVSHDDVYNIYFRGMKRPVRNVDITNIELPSPRYFDLLMGKGVVKCSVDFGGNVHEEMIHNFKKKSILKAQYDKQKQVNKELGFDVREGEQSPVRKKKEKDLTEHVGDVRKNVRHGSRRRRKRIPDEEELFEDFEEEEIY